MDTEALVSIIITTYRRPELLSRAITSVLEQTYPKVEVIVVDDNNPVSEERKETEHVMESFKDNAKVVYVKHDSNKRNPAALNTGIKYSQGHYIGTLDDDDEFLPNKVEEQIKLLKAYEDDDTVGGVACNIYKDFCGRTIQTHYSQEQYAQNMIYPVLMETVIANYGSTVLYKRDVLKKLTGYNEKLIRHVDWEFFTRFFNYYRMVFVEEPLVKIHVDGARNNPQTDLYLKAKNIFFREVDPYLDIIGAKKKKAIYRHHYFDVSISFFANKMFRKGFHTLRHAMQYGFLDRQEWILLCKVVVKNSLNHINR